MHANHLRLWFASASLVLMRAPPYPALPARFTDATCGKMRPKLLKMGTLVWISVRRVTAALAAACP